MIERTIDKRDSKESRVGLERLSTKQYADTTASQRERVSVQVCACERHVCFSLLCESVSVALTVLLPSCYIHLYWPLYVRLYYHLMYLLLLSHIYHILFISYSSPLFLFLYLSPSFSPPFFSYHSMSMFTFFHILSVYTVAFSYFSISYFLSVCLLLLFLFLHYL